MDERTTVCLVPTIPQRPPESERVTEGERKSAHTHTRKRRDSALRGFLFLASRVPLRTSLLQDRDKSDNMKGPIRHWGTKYVDGAR